MMRKIKNKLTDWIKGNEKITQKLENIKNTEDTVELVVFSINKTEITICAEFNRLNRFARNLIG